MLLVPEMIMMFRELPGEPDLRGNDAESSGDNRTADSVAELQQVT